MDSGHEDRTHRGLRQAAGAAIGKRPSGSDPSPSEVRRAVLRDHTILRGIAADAAAEADRVQTGERDATGLRARARLLARELALHIAMEEEILAPLLARIDAWGALRVEQMHADHDHQLEDLRRFADETQSEGSPARLAAEVRRFVTELFHDMRREEHDLLHPDLLRDDVVSIDQCSG